MPVLLHHGYFWVCPDCDSENFVRGKELELTDEDLQELQEEHDITPWDLSEQVVVEVPDQVVCKHCDSEFETDR